MEVFSPVFMRLKTEHHGFTRLISAMAEMRLSVSRNRNDPGMPGGIYLKENKIPHQIFLKNKEKYLTYCDSMIYYLI